MGAYVSLLEYDSIEGMILLSELSRRRIRSVNKLIRVGRMEVGDPTITVTAIVIMSKGGRGSSRRQGEGIHRLVEAPSHQ